MIRGSDEENAKKVHDRIKKLGVELKLSEQQLNDLAIRITGHTPESTAEWKIVGSILVKIKKKLGTDTSLKLESVIDDIIITTIANLAINIDTVAKAMVINDEDAINAITKLLGGREPKAIGDYVEVQRFWKRVKERLQSMGTTKNVLDAIDEIVDEETGGVTRFGDEIFVTGDQRKDFGEKQTTTPVPTRTKSEPVVDRRQPKRIVIDWDNLPSHVIATKFPLALEYTFAETDGKKYFTVGDGAALHKTSEECCDCKNWIAEGTSLNPCKHMIRVHYTHSEIMTKIAAIGAAAGMKGKKPTPMKSEIETQKSERTNGETLVRIDDDTPQSDTQAPLMVHGMIPRLAEVGKIKIGGKSERKTGTGYLLPEKWDHFEIATMMKDENDRLIMDDAMNRIIGNIPNTKDPTKSEKCTELDIMLCYDAPDMNMAVFYAQFTKSRLVCMGDGKTAHLRNEDGTQTEKKCDPDTCEAYKQKKCKLHGRLVVVLTKANRIGGAFVFRTTSFYTIRNILSAMHFIGILSHGVLAGIPLKMRLMPMTVTPKDMDHTIPTFVVNIEFAGSQDQFNACIDREVARRLALGMNMKQLEADSRKQLSEQIKIEAIEDAADIEEEFPGTSMEDE